jgi:glycosyltransferase involved in cell wall biosynthesis
MKALFVAPNLGIGGAERQWETLLPRLAQRDFDVCVLTLDGCGPVAERLANQGIEVRCAEMRKRTDAHGWRHALSLYDRAEVVVSRGTSALVLGEILSRRFHAPHVATVHNILGREGRHDGLRRELLMRWPLRRADSVVAVSGAIVPSLQRIGVKRSRIAVIPNGVDTETLRPAESRTALRSALGVGNHEFAILLLAGLRPEKRPLDFVNAVQEARRIDKRVRGFIVGDGPLRNDVSAACAASERGVSYLGAADAVSALLDSMDAICLTSASEASPLAIIEAQAAGLPVVATAVGGVPALVSDGWEGLLVPLGQADALVAAVCRLAADPNLRREMGRRGRIRAERHHSAETMTDAYAQLLRTVTADGSAAEARHHSGVSP